MSQSIHLDKDLKGSGRKKINDDEFTEEDMDDNKRKFMQDKELYNNGETSDLQLDSHHIPRLQETKKRKRKEKDDMQMNLGKELGDQPHKNINHDSDTDEDPEEFKNQMLDKEIFGKDKRHSMEDDEDIPNLKSSKTKNRKKKEEGIDDGKMKDAHQ